MLLHPGNSFPLCCPSAHSDALQWDISPSPVWLTAGYQFLHEQCQESDVKISRDELCVQSCRKASPTLPSLSWLPSARALPNLRGAGGSSPLCKLIPSKVCLPSIDSSLEVFNVGRTNLSYYQNWAYWYQWWPHKKTEDSSPNDTTPKWKLVTTS